MFSLPSEFHNTERSAETAHGALFQIIYFPKTALRTHKLHVEKKLGVTAQTSFQTQALAPRVRPQFGIS